MVVEEQLKLGVSESVCVDDGVEDKQLLKEVVEDGVEDKELDTVVVVEWLELCVVEADRAKD